VPFGLVVALPFRTHDPGEFSNRGFIWAVSLDWWHSAPWWGLGSDYYAKIGQTSERVASTVFEGHNEFVHLAVTGGWALLCLVALQLLTLAVRVGRLAASGQGIGVVYMVALAGTCLLEKSIGFVDSTAVFPVVVVPLSVLMFTTLSKPVTPTPDTPRHPASRTRGDTRR
jgi:O-antigen ligase